MKFNSSVGKKIKYIKLKDFIDRQIASKRRKEENEKCQIEIKKTEMFKWNSDGIEM
jgi:hypothetical protein